MGFLLPSSSWLLKLPSKNPVPAGTIGSQTNMLWASQHANVTNESIDDYSSAINRHHDICFQKEEIRRAVCIFSSLRSHHIETSRCNSSTTLFVQGPAVSGIIKVLVGVDRPTQPRGS